VGRIDSASCVMEGFGIDGLEPSGSASSIIRLDESYGNLLQVWTMDGTGSTSWPNTGYCVQHLRGAA
jgi:hypothetical protein